MADEQQTRTRQPNKLEQLYLGTGGFDIVGKRKRWYIATAVLLLVCIGSMVFKGFTPSIDFVGGTKVQLPATSTEGPIAADDAKQVYREVIGTDPVSVQEIGRGGDATVDIRSETLNNAQVSELKKALFDELQPVGANGQPAPGSVSDRALSGSWGEEISQQAIIALLAFTVLVTIFLIFYYERSMATAAMISTAADMVVTAGVYSLVGLEVTPSSVIGLLTILGFSLYDTVIVFDKVRENSKGILDLSKQTFPEAANLAVNQTLMRSLNTSMTSVIPVLALLVIGAGMLGAGTLKDLALIMTIGTIVGTLSSLYLATPLLVDLKMREKPYQEQAARVASRRALARRRSGEQAEVADVDGAETEGREKALATAASVPGRNLKKVDEKRIAGKRPTGKRPTGKRPSGKRNR